MLKSQKYLAKKKHSKDNPERLSKITKILLTFSSAHKSKLKKPMWYTIIYVSQ